MSDFIKVILRVSEEESRIISAALFARRMGLHESLIADGRRVAQFDDPYYPRVIHLGHWPVFQLLREQYFTESFYLRGNVITIEGDRDDVVHKFAYFLERVLGREELEAVEVVKYKTTKPELKWYEYGRDKWKNKTRVW